MKTIRVKAYDAVNHIEHKGYVRPIDGELMNLYVKGSRYTVSWEQVARAINTNTCLVI